MENRNPDNAPGFIKNKTGRVGAIGAWAWGLSRIMDYLEKDKDVNAKKVAVVGLPVWGKPLSGLGPQIRGSESLFPTNRVKVGAALARRWYGETVKK